MTTTLNLTLNGRNFKRFPIDPQMMPVYGKWMDETLEDAARRMSPSMRSGTHTYSITPNQVAAKYFDDGWFHDSQWAFGHDFPKLDYCQVEQLMPELTIEWVKWHASEAGFEYDWPVGDASDVLRKIGDDLTLTAKFIETDHIW